EAVGQPLDLDVHRVRRTNRDAGRMDIADGSTGSFALFHEHVRMPITFDVITGQFGLKHQVKLGIVTQRLREEKVAARTGGYVPQRLHHVIGKGTTPAVLHFSVNRERTFLANIRFVADDAGNLRQVLDPYRLQGADCRIGAEILVVRLEDRPHRLRVENGWHRGEGWIRRKEEHEVIAFREKPHMPLRIQRVAIAVPEHPGNPVTIVFAVRVVEERLGPDERSDLHPSGELQLGLVDVPKDPRSFEAPARYGSYLLHAHGR